MPQYPETKICTKCGKELPAKEFRKDKTKKDGLYPSCNDCHRKTFRVKKQVHNVIGTYKGYLITLISQRSPKNKSYPMIIGVPGGRREAHRYIMEEILGRKLSSNEHVHHIDGNKLNYDSTNLIVLTKSEHHTLHGKTLPHRGEVVYCNKCGNKGYYFPSHIREYYGGDRDRLRKTYLCKVCYIKSKRWLKHEKSRKTPIRVGFPYSRS